MPVPLTKLLQDAAADGYAVMAPDFLSLYMLKLELAVAEAHGAPVLTVCKIPFACHGRATSVSFSGTPSNPSWNDISPSPKARTGLDF